MKNRAIVIGSLTAASLCLMSLGSAASALGPQPLPEAACNRGTAIPWTGYFDNAIPHWVDWDGDGEPACYHLNPTYPPGVGSGLE
jgi:hypothetical protein